MKMPFDKIYCLHLADDIDRYEYCVNEFNKIGILDQVEFWWTCKRNISNDIGYTIPTLIDDNYERELNRNIISRNELYGNIFNCTLEHYTIMKTSYLRGFDNILIMEDDVRFIDNLELIEDTFNNLPNNYDIIKFYDTEGSVCEGWYSNDKSNKQVFRKIYNFAHGTVCYALSNHGMKEYCSLIDNEFVPVDQINIVPLTLNGIINAYNLEYRIILDSINKSRILNPN